MKKDTLGFSMGIVGAAVQASGDALMDAIIANNNLKRSGDKVDCMKHGLTAGVIGSLIAKALENIAFMRCLRRILEDDGHKEQADFVHDAEKVCLLMAKNAMGCLTFYDQAHTREHPGRSKEDDTEMENERKLLSEKLKGEVPEDEVHDLMLEIIGAIPFELEEMKLERFPMGFDHPWIERAIEISMPGRKKFLAGLIDSFENPAKRKEFADLEEKRLQGRKH